MTRPHTSALLACTIFSALVSSFSAASFAQVPATPAPATPIPAQKPAPKSEALPARGTVQVVGNAAELSVFAVSVDAQELFTEIAARAKLKLVVDDTVSRRLTISLQKKPAREILDAIVSAYGLSASDVDGVLMISEGIPRSPSSYLLSDITSIPTRYVNAANARNLLPVFLQDYVRVNSEQNAVVLSAPTEVLNKFREDIAQFDIPAAQILVEVQLIELTDTSVDALGLNLTYQNGREGATIDPVTGNIGYKAIATLPNNFTANLRALQERGLARVKASPRIATVSGRRASIFVGRQRYVATPIDAGDRGGQRNFIDAGVRLNIFPYTGGQGQILIDVDAEVSTLSAPDPTTNLPEKSTRTASTAVRVNDNQTIVIGGLIQQETRSVRTRIPVLSDIPVLGKLFQNSDTRTARTELVLLVTPRILSPTGHLPEGEERKLKERYLDPSMEPKKAAPTKAESGKAEPAKP